MDVAAEPDSLVVLVVEDEHDLADLYARWLQDEYEVRTAYDGEQALEQMDDAVDVVLLDRRLPGISGDEFLERIRADGYDCQVAMVSAVDPDFDIVEMGFDDYVVKPVDSDELHAVVRRLTSLETTSDESQDYFALVSKKEALESEKDSTELQGNAEYARLLETIDAHRAEVLALADAYVNELPGQVSDDRADIYKAKIQEWRERRRDVSEGDPLYETATAEIERNTKLLEEGTRPSEPERKLLEVVASEFLAEDFWLDERIRLALNKIFFGKLTDSLVINNVSLDPDRSRSREEYFEATQAVREKAEKRLEELD